MKFIIIHLILFWQSFSTKNFKFIVSFPIMLRIDWEKSNIKGHKNNIERYKNEIKILYEALKKDLTNETAISKFRFWIQ